MKKKSQHKLGSVILVLLFLIGLFLVIWPVATELFFYKKDDAEYEAMSTEFRLPESNPISISVSTVTPDRKSTRLNSSHPTTSRMPSSA